MERILQGNGGGGVGYVLLDGGMGLAWSALLQV
jgi:hypothetical protein